MKELILLVGPPGSGKTTYCEQHLKEYKRISQDDLGKKGHWVEYKRQLSEGNRRIVIDRLNHKKEQRLKYLTEAKKFGYFCKVIQIHSPYTLCLNRALTRKNHPTLTTPQITERALKCYFNAFEEVASEEADTLEYVNNIF